MQFASALSTRSDPLAAVDDLIEQTGATLAPASANLLLLFCSAHHEDQLNQVVTRLGETFGRAGIFGCTAEGTLGADREVQSTCSMSMLVGSLPGVRLHPFHLDRDRIEALDDAELPSLLGVDTDNPPLVLVFGEPFSFPIVDFLKRTNRDLPGVPIIGGMASAAERPGQNRLILNGQLYDDGLVGVTLTGPFSATTVVSQGCRPIGEPFVVTQGHHNVIQELGGKTTLVRLREVFADLSPDDVRLAKQALFVGRVMHEYQERFQRGDFLIQNIIGLDAEEGALALAAPVQVGSTIQFHVRDAGCADDDLRELLARAKPAFIHRPPAGALLVNCNGRGRRMWPSQQGHDVTLIHEIYGDIPVAGFFAAGEIGPVAGRNFVHGFTASIVLLAEQKTQDPQGLPENM
ncbi:MAG: FIST N-terminal domain-containing protein [Phycisphaerae bacterium]